MTQATSTTSPSGVAQAPVTVRSLVDQIVRSGPTAQATRWGSGVQRSDLARIGVRAFTAEWKQRGHIPLRSSTAPLPRSAIDPAVHLLAELTPLIDLVAAASAQVITQARVYAERVGAEVTLEQISSRCTSAAGAYVRRYRAAPPQHAVEKMAARVVEAVAQSWARLTKNEFEITFAAAYDREWEIMGADTLTHYPPSWVLLGNDRRPDLVYRGAPRETDLWGTDRSVYSRYAGYRPVAPGHRVPFRSRAARCVQPVTMRPTGRDIGNEAVRAACSPYGVQDPSHRVTLRGAHAGLDFDEERAHTPSGTDLSEHCTTLYRATENDIAHTVHRAAMSRIRRRTTAPRTTPRSLDVERMHWQIDRFDQGTTAAQEHLIATVVMRRLWKSVHGLEQLVEEPMCSCSLVAAITTALDRAVPSVLSRGQVLPVSAADAPSDLPTAAPADIERLLAAQNATTALLAADPARARAVMLLEPGWASTYRELTAHAPDTYLTAREFATWCAELIPGTHHVDEAELTR